MKMEHQEKIMKLFRYSYSPHLFKYYKSYCLIDDPDLNGLFMDASNYISLKQYIQSFKINISLRSKLFLLTQVAQGLRILKDNKVVHMNLHPNNILVLKDLQIKLIDFTCAFNQKICQDGIYWIIQTIFWIILCHILLPKSSCLETQITTIGKTSIHLESQHIGQSFMNYPSKMSII